MVRPMVHSQKHYVQTSIASILGGATLGVVLVDAVAVSDKNSVSEVEEGSNVKAIYCEYWLKAGEASNLCTHVTAIYKAPAGASGATFAEMAALGNFDNKKNILFTSQGLLNTEGSQATNILHQWIKIPKSKQRFGLGDRILLTVSASATSDVDICGFSLYKEYT